MASEALVLEDIDAFYGDSHVLHHVSLQLGQGRLLGLLGRNGAGKSTSMSVTVGLLAPRGGTVEVFGHPLTGRAPETIAAHGVALVPQGRQCEGGYSSTKGSQHSVRDSPLELSPRGTRGLMVLHLNVDSFNFSF